MLSDPVHSKIMPSGVGAGSIVGRIHEDLAAVTVFRSMCLLHRFSLESAPLRRVDVRLAPDMHAFRGVVASSARAKPSLRFCTFP